MKLLGGGFYIPMTARVIHPTMSAGHNAGTARCELRPKK